MERKRVFLDYFLLYFSFIIYSLVAVCSKLASAQKNIHSMIMYIFSEVLLLGIYAVLWQQVLKRFQLSVAMANKGITIIFSLIWSVIIFRDKIGILSIVGAFIVVCGIVLVSLDD